jgi:sugar lactone lactonase YvrE
MQRFVAAPFFDPPSDALRFLPEGPRVLRNCPGNNGKLGWVAIQHGADLLEGSINILDLASQRNQSFPLPGRPGFFAETTRPGVLLVGLERDLILFDLATSRVEKLGVHVTDDDRVIINDGLAVEGGVLFGTKHLEFNQPIAALYYFDAARRSVHTVLDGQICSNGKFLTRDTAGATLVDIDSIPKTIARYRLDATLKSIIERALIVAPDSLPASPDGLRPSPIEEVEVEPQSIVVAFYNGAEVVDGLAQLIRLRDGATLAEWTIPGAPRVTCPEFVEIDGKVKILFTTALEGMPESLRRRASGSGCLYIADTPFSKMPEPPPLVDLQ